MKAEFYAMHQWTPGEGKVPAERQKELEAIE
jgi:hypothetical protein